VCYHLALAYKEHNKKSEAVAYLQKAFGLGDFPECLEAKALLAQLNKGTGPRAR
jgi:hypothetical protein